MEHKNIFACLGAIALSGAIGIGAFITSNQVRKASAVVEEKPLDNILVYFNEEQDYSDTGVITSERGYTIYGSFTSLIDGSRYTSIGLDTSDTIVDNIILYNNTTTSILYSNGSYDSGLLANNYLIRANNIEVWDDEISAQLSYQDTWRFLRALFNASFIPQANNFNFNAQINYYAPYYANVSSQFVNDDTMVNASDINTINFIEGFWFKCAGGYYNRINLTYINAQGLVFDSSGEPLSSSGFASYTFMSYENTYTGAILIVNNRDMVQYSKNNAVGYYQASSSSWASPSYKTIQVFTTFDDEQLAFINRLNNSNYSASDFYISGGENVGLGDAFTLLSDAFKATTSLFTIQVLPGISLGLLLFLPLIAGIIILIVWVVKR